MNIHLFIESLGKADRSADQKYVLKRVDFISRCEMPFIGHPLVSGLQRMRRLEQQYMIS